MGAGIFQNEAHAILAKTFGKDNVHSEFSIGTNATDVFAGTKRYLPRLDIAVGPFNVSTKRAENTRMIESAANHELIHKIIKLAASQNRGRFAANQNPRCLLAIEIEFSGSSKLIVGDFTNASMMGLVGLVVGPARQNYMRKILQVSEYVRTLRDLGKAPPNLFTNLAFMDENEFRALF
jgi:hypothetical protein